MLSREENELLTRVSAGTPTGDMMRRYWIPVCLSEEIKENDGDPVPVRILGEDLVAFRDSKGRVGLIDRYCPHRTASLVFGRNEECGLRCLYHGWKFDVNGNCVDMPSEPEEYNFKERIHVKAYPVREAGGLVWAYMGPTGESPKFPDFEWTHLSDEQRAIVKIVEEANYLQAIEGSIDSAHSWFLHRGSVGDWKTRSSVSEDTSPKLEAENTSYGFRYAAIRKPVIDPEKFRYVRVTLFILPFFSYIPRSLDRNEPAHFQIFVPVDDTHTIFFGVFFSQNGNPVDTEGTRARIHVVPGIDLDENWHKKRRVENRYFQDRLAMKLGDFTGISGFTNQDMAMQESMGPIADRTKEHLGTSDIAIIRMRKRMLESVRKFMNGERPIGLDTEIAYDKLRSEQKLIPVETPWQSVGAFAGEYSGQVVATNET